MLNLLYGSERHQYFLSAGEPRIDSHCLNWVVLFEKILKAIRFRTKFQLNNTLRSIRTNQPKKFIDPKNGPKVARSHLELRTISVFHFPAMTPFVFGNLSKVNWISASRDDCPDTSLYPFRWDSLAIPLQISPLLVLTARLLFTPSPKISSPLCFSSFTF